MKDRNWVERVEMVASICVVVSVVLLVLEVRQNTRAIERQILSDRVSNLTVPFLEGPELLMAFQAVKSVDGWDELHRAFMEEYGLEPAQAVAWTFHLNRVWNGLQIDFFADGPSDVMARGVKSLLAYPDQRLFWKHERFSPEFTAYVESLTGIQAAGTGRID